MSGNRRPPTVTPSVFRALVRRLAVTDGLLLGLDFDGTLAPIADDPDEPRITPACRASLAPFVDDPSSRVAVVSGRELADLRPRVGIDGIDYAGNHGLELVRGGSYAVHPVAARYRPSVRYSTERLSERLAGEPGVVVEDKGLTASVHVRHVPPGRRDRVFRTVREVVSTSDAGLSLETGKQVIEVRPPAEWDKGDAMTAFAGEVGEGWSAVYLGDDETDEDAFYAVRRAGAGVLVGERPGTAATVRLESQERVAPFLRQLAEGLRGRR